MLENYELFHFIEAFPTIHRKTKNKIKVFSSIFLLDKPVNLKLFTSTRTIYHREEIALLEMIQTGDRRTHFTAPNATALESIMCIFLCEIRLTMTRTGKNTAMIQVSRLLNIIQMSSFEDPDTV